MSTKKSTATAKVAAVKPVATKPAAKAPVAKHARAKGAAIAKLIAWQGGQAELSRVALVSRVAVNRWVSAGAVGKETALMLSNVKGCPLTFEEIRPDLKGHVFDKQTIKMAKEDARTANEYIKERDAAAKAAAKAA